MLSGLAYAAADSGVVRMELAGSAANPPLVVMPVSYTHLDVYKRQIEVGGHVYRCAYGRGHGTVDMKTALEQSCNCYFVQLGLRLGAQTVYDITKSAGFGQSQQVAGGLRAASGNLPDAAQLEDLGQLEMCIRDSL